MLSKQPTKDMTPTKARQGIISGRVSRVLFISFFSAVILLGIVVLTWVNSP